MSIRRGCSLLGEHGPDRIRLQRGLSPLKSWQVFLHEFAHYRVWHHRRAFVLELARVYRLRRDWSARPRAATGDTRGVGGPAHSRPRDRSVEENCCVP